MVSQSATNTVRVYYMLTENFGKERSLRLIDHNITKFVDFGAW